MHRCGRVWPPLPSRLASLTVGVACLCASVVQAQEPCRLALALGLDVSGSVNPREYRLQLDGLAAALGDPGIQAAFLAIPQAPVRIMVYEWSGAHEQRALIDWTTATNAERLNAVAQTLRQTGSTHINDPSTAISAAMTYGATALAQQRDCWKKTLDISGGGPANVGTHPQHVVTQELGNIVINGLIIGANARANVTKDLTNVKSLEEYYRAYVLRGPGAFAEVAVDYDDFARAMKRKLMREIAPPTLSSLQ